MTTIAERLTAAFAGHYAIERELGVGGMATVYLAQDLKHHRPVAVKVLRTELAATMGAERFSREIEVVARLQHPHILPLLDSGEAGGFYYYVMPYIDGESLRERLARQGELPVHEAVRVLTQVVDALAYAHAHGVVHRDIKPDNVLLSGRHALVTDFGVAKAVSEATGRHTLTSIGVALGTPAYMAPEQAAADPHLDHRVDLYAVGVLGYELLTGRPPFAGLTAQETLAAHVTQTPEPVDKHRPGISPSLSAVLMRCLAKRPADRWQSADELLAQLEPLATPSGGTTPTATVPVSVPTRLPRWAAWGLGAAGLMLAIGAVMFSRSRTQALSLGTVTQITYEPGLEIEPALSPDGKFVAYASGSLPRTRLYVRQAGGRPVALTADSRERQRRPLWSPDGTKILFSMSSDDSQDALYIMPALGGSPRLLARDACCGAWSPDGRQVAYVRVPVGEGSDSILATPSEGGPARFVGFATAPHSLAWSPDGRWLALVSGNPPFALSTLTFANKGPCAIVVVPAAGGSPVAVTDNAALNVSPTWTSDSRRLLFVSDREGARDVYAVQFGGSGTPASTPSRLTTGLNAHSISLSADGTRLAYSVYTSRDNVWAIPIPSAGPVSVNDATPVTTGNQTVESMAFSPDGRWLYFDSDRAGNADIYRMPAGGGEPQQLTTHPTDDFAPAISPDGRWIAFHSLRFGTRDIFVMPAEGGAAQRVTDDAGEERAPKWSPDGQSLSYNMAGTGTRDGVYVITRSQSDRWGRPRQIWNRWFSPAYWSPDGRTLLLSGGTEGVAGGTEGIWVIPAAGDTARQVYRPAADVGAYGLAGVRNAQWSPDGRTIYFKGFDREGRASFWALSLETGRPRLLVRVDDPAKPSFRLEWTTDGRRLLFTINDRQSDIYVAEVRGLR